MSDKNNSIAVHSPTDGAVSVTGAPDVEMVDALDSNCAPAMVKHTRNVQTQHGDYRFVDELNIFLIPRCLWPENKPKTWLPTTSTKNLKEDLKDESKDESKEELKDESKEESKEKPMEESKVELKKEPEEEEEQVVWIEPFADEVCFFFLGHLLVIFLSCN